MIINLIINNIYIYILSLGVILSIIFFHFYLIKSFNLNYNNKHYPVWVYLLLLFFIIFYIFLFPFIIFKIIESEKFIELKNEYINKCIKSIEPNYMDSNEQGEGSGHGRRISENNSSNSNTVNVNISNLQDRPDLEVVGNNANNANSVTVNTNRSNIGTVNIMGMGLEVNRVSRGSLNLGLPIITRQESSLLPPYSNANDQISNINPQEHNEGTSHKAINTINLDDLFDEINSLLTENNLGDEDEIDIEYVVREDVINNESLTSNIKDDISLIKDNKLNIDNEEKHLIKDSQTNKYNDNKFSLKKNMKNIGSIMIMKKFKSESSLNKLFKLSLNKPVAVEIVDNSIINYNIFRVSNELYESLLSNSKALFRSLANNIPLIEERITASIHLKNIIHYAEIYNIIQYNLDRLIKGNNEQGILSLKYIVDKRLFKYDSSGLESNNEKFNNELFTKLSEIFQLPMIGFNPNILREFYILNDFNYLTHNNKGNVYLPLLYELIGLNYDVSTIVDYYNDVNYTSIFNNKEFSDFYKAYTSLHNDYKRIHNTMHDSTVNLFNKRHDKPYILHNNIKKIKTREIHYFYHLLYNNNK